MDGGPSQSAQLLALPFTPYTCTMPLTRQEKQVWPTWVGLAACAGLLNSMAKLYAHTGVSKQE
jgi:hypothetical protein